MRTIQFAATAIVSPNPITLPAGAPDIDAVVTAEIERLPAALGDHTQAEVIDAIAVHAQALIAGALLDHPVHNHDLVSQGLGGGVTNALGLDAGLTAIEDAGGVATHTVPGGGATGVQDNAAAQAHAAGAAPVGHLVGANPLAHVGDDPIVAAVPTRISTRTFSLDVNTLVGDLVTLNYLEVGERVLVS